LCFLKFSKIWCVFDLFGGPLGFWGGGGLTPPPPCAPLLQDNLSSGPEHYLKKKLNHDSDPFK